VNFEGKNIKELFKLADKVGKKRYHKLTSQDFEDYKRFNHWRYICGNGECGTTEESQNWVKNNSDCHCPICGDKFSEFNGRTIDHKLPRSQYPWLSMDFRNFWVICRDCNKEKGEMHWYEYEHYMSIHHPDCLDAIKAVRPKQLIMSLRK